MEDLKKLVSELRESIESMHESHNTNPQGVGGWEIGLALARLKAVEFLISRMEPESEDRVE